MTAERMAPDQIRKEVVLRAPLERVWRAISDAKEFGAWFGVRFDGPFEVGAVMKGVITPTQVDAGVAKAQEPYAGKPFEITIDRIEPMKVFAFRWHPYAVEEGVDYSEEPTTLVSFELEEVAGGVKLVITESGFEGIPFKRRLEAFERNEGGWGMSTGLIRKYVEAG